MKPWKINTVLSLDGFNVCITGIGGGGKCLSAQPIMQLSLPYELVKYLKKIEKFVEKIKTMLTIFMMNNMIRFLWMGILNYMMFI